MQNLSDKMGENQFAIVHGTCMDCHKECSINLERTGPETIEIKNGAIGNRNDEYYFKCDSCWEKDKNFGQQSEVYSRVVGYLRPVSQWNDAKTEEFHKRTMYTMPETA